MSFQLEDVSGCDSSPIHRLSMLHLSPSVNHHPTSTITTTMTARRRPTKFEKCSHCGILKRRSPLQHSSSKTTTTGGCNHQASTNRPLNNPILHRSLSNPIYFEEIQNIEAPKPQFSSPLSPENSKTGTNSPAMASLPPLPPPLRRSLSEPGGSNYQEAVAAATTPPSLPQPARTAKRSPVSDESTDSKRLKRMKERMKEMSEWCGQALNEEDQNVNSPCNLKVQDECEKEHGEEAVWVEKQDGGLMIHFNCPCGKAFGIFLHGNSCYYKLM